MRGSGPHLPAGALGKEAAGRTPESTVDLGRPAGQPSGRAMISAERSEPSRRR